MSWEPGAILASKYRIERTLGTGGMGVVVLATHLELDQPVAIKLPRPEYVKDATFAARFLREGKNAARIRNDHVARVLDVGRDEADNPFLVMEYLEGIDLSAQLRASGPLPIASAVDIVLQACEAVGAAHAVGIIHRDLKPANLFLETRHDGSFFVKVLDFGISKAVNDPAALENALTNTTGVVGSPMYMSPEQMISARDVDARTDVWSLGVILFRVLTGKVPWPSTNPLELAARMAKEPPLRPRALRPEIPQGLEDVLMRVIERDRERRIATIVELATALAPFDPGRGEATARRVPRFGVPARAPDPSPPAEAESSTMATTAISLHTINEPTSVVASQPQPTPPARSPSSRRGLYVGLAAIPVLAIALIVVLTRGSSSPTPTNASHGAQTAEPLARPSASIEPAAAPEPVAPASASVSATAKEPEPAPVATPAPAPAPIKPVASTTPKPAAAKTKATADPWGSW